MPDLPFFDARDFSTPEPDRIDLHILQNSHVHRCGTKDDLDALVARLQQLGYLIHLINAGHWADERAMHRDLAARLHFPDYYGHNLDAFNDMLFDMGSFRYSHGGSDETTTGTVLALTDFDVFHTRTPKLAHQVLDIFARQARSALLGLHPMLCLVHSTHDLQPVGATEVDYG